jgi:hypothetical protein
MVIETATGEDMEGQSPGGGWRKLHKNVSNAQSALVADMDVIYWLLITE